MNDALAPRHRAGRLLAGAGTGRGDRVRGDARLLVPVRLRIRARASYAKADVFGLCDTLARAEQALRRAGQLHEAAQVAAAFDLVESGLA